MSRCRTLLWRAGAVSLAVIACTSPPAPAAMPPAERLLAVEMNRAARIFLSGSTISVASIDAAMRILQEAARLDPDSIELWHDILDLATLAERDEDKSLALRRVIELDPADEVARLRRIAEFVDRAQTVETRIVAYEQLLEPGTRDRLGAAVSSRLALDLAHLQRRAGHDETFSQWLGEAVALDPSNRAAAALAAGYFRLFLDDPYAEAELLTSLVLADPTDAESTATLAELLIRNGAYRGAARMYRLAAACQRARRGGESPDLLADYAIALWAAGDAPAALLMIREHQQRMNDILESERRVARPDTPLPELTLSERLLPPTIAAVRALILTESGDDGADRAVIQLVQSIEKQIDLAREADPPDEARAAELDLDLALVLAWTGRNPERLEELLAQVQAFQPLSDAAERRFAGWQALRRGDNAAAEELFTTHAESDQPSAMGLALAQMRQGRAAEASHQLLAIVREEPGTLIGAWAVQKLMEILGRHVAVSDLAARLETLIDTIPRQIDRYPQSGTLAVSLRVRPLLSTCDAFDPIIVDIEVLNLSQYPLAIDLDGPIRPQVLLRPSAQVLSGRPSEDFPPIIVDVGRRLRLGPGESIVVPYDLRRTGVGRAMNEYAASGGLVSVEAQINFKTNERGVIEPGLLGSRTNSRHIRIEGATVDDAWLEDAAAIVRNPASPERLRTLAIICNVIGSGGGLQIGSAGTSEPARSNAAAAVMEVFPSLDHASQAWLLAVTPIGNAPAAAPLLDIARRSDDRLVQLSYLLFHLSGPDDPMIDAARRGGDGMLGAVADVMQSLLRRLLEQQAGGAPGATGSGG